MAGCSEGGEQPPTSTSTTPTTPREPPRPTTTAQLPYADRFSSIVDVSAAGADTSGERPVNDLLSDLAEDDTLLYLPQGRYHLDEAFVLHEFTNVGIVGDDATIVPPEGYSDIMFAIGQPGTARGFLIDGITFDYRAEETGGRPLFVKVDDGLLVRDVTVTGSQDVDEELMRFDVSSPSGSGLVERVRMPHGATVGMEATGCYVGETNRGDLTFRDCHVAGFPDNGLYAEPPEGKIRVIGGLYENNDTSNVRVGGEGLIRGVHVRCDSAPETFENMRGIRLREGGGTVIEDCFVEFLDVTSSDGAIAISTEMNSATIRNTEIRIDTDYVAAILGKSPRRGDGDQSIRCENVHIRGAAAEASTVRVEGRDGCVFEGMSIEQTGANRDGIELVDSVENFIRNTRIDVSEDPVQLINATARSESVFANGVELSLS